MQDYFVLLHFALRNHITFRLESEDITNRFNLTLKLYQTRRSLPVADQRKSSLGMESTGEATVNIVEMTKESGYNKDLVDKSASVFEKIDSDFETKFIVGKMISNSNPCLQRNLH